MDSFQFKTSKDQAVVFIHKRLLGIYSAKSFQCLSRVFTEAPILNSIGLHRSSLNLAFQRGQKVLCFFSNVRHPVLCGPSETRVLDQIESKAIQDNLRSDKSILQFFQKDQRLYFLDENLENVWIYDLNEKSHHLKISYFPNGQKIQRMANCGKFGTSNKWYFI